MMAIGLLESGGAEIGQALVRFSGRTASVAWEQATRLCGGASAWRALLVGIVALFGAAFSAPACAYDSTTFYIVAHEDDWQLFMSLNAWSDVAWASKNKTVFVHLTAGDAGQGDGPYYKAREEGAKRAIRFLATINGYYGPIPDSQVMQLNGKKLDRIEYNNTVAYFLRLPDGSLGGCGYEATGNQSLTALKGGCSKTGEEKPISSIALVGGEKLTFYTWAELYETIALIMQTEASSPNGTPSVWVNFQDPDTTNNPNDHPDHKASGEAVQTALKKYLPCANQAMFQDYVIATKPINLCSPEEKGVGCSPPSSAPPRSEWSQWLHAALWSVTNSGLVDSGVSTSWNEDHNKWLGRVYLRTKPGNGSCSF